MGGALFLENHRRDRRLDGYLTVGMGWRFGMVGERGMGMMGMGMGMGMNKGGELNAGKWKVGEMVDEKMCEQLPELSELRFQSQVTPNGTRTSRDHISRLIVSPSPYLSSTGSKAIFFPLCPWPPFPFPSPRQQGTSQTSPRSP